MHLSRHGGACRENVYFVVVKVIIYKPNYKIMVTFILSTHVKDVKINQNVLVPRSARNYHTNSLLRVCIII